MRAASWRFLGVLVGLPLLALLGRTASGDAVSRGITHLSLENLSRTTLAPNTVVSTLNGEEASDKVYSLGTNTGGGQTVSIDQPAAHAADRVFIRICNSNPKATGLQGSYPPPPTVDGDRLIRRVSVRVWWDSVGNALAGEARIDFWCGCPATINLSPSLPCKPPKEAKVALLAAGGAVVPEINASGHLPKPYEYIKLKNTSNRPVGKVRATNVQAPHQIMQPIPAAGTAYVQSSPVHADENNATVVHVCFPAVAEAVPAKVLSATLSLGATKRVWHLRLDATGNNADATVTGVAVLWNKLPNGSQEEVVLNFAMVNECPPDEE